VPRGRVQSYWGLDCFRSPLSPIPLFLATHPVNFIHAFLLNTLYIKTSTLAKRRDKCLAFFRLDGTASKPRLLPCCGFVSVWLWLKVDQKRNWLEQTNVNKMMEEKRSAFLNSNSIQPDQRYIYNLPKPRLYLSRFNWTLIFKFFHVRPEVPSSEASACFFFHHSFNWDNQSLKLENLMHFSSSYFQTVYSGIQRKPDQSSNRCCIAVALMCTQVGWCDVVAIIIEQKPFIGR